MAKEKNLIIFHNRKLMHISPECVSLFGGNAFVLKGQSFHEVFTNKYDDYIDKLKENKKTQSVLITSDKNIINCEITKSVINNNEVVCVYYKDKDAQIVHTPSLSAGEGIFQETIGKNISDVFSDLNSIENTRNSDVIAKIKSRLFSFSLDMFDLLSQNVKGKVTTFDASYIYFDLPIFIESEISSLKEAFKENTINFVPTILLPFKINANEDAFRDLLYGITKYLSKSSETIVFNLYLNSKNLVLDIEENELYMNTLKSSPKVSEVDFKDINELIHLHELAKKAGVEFSCREHESRVCKFEFQFLCAERKRIYEEDEE